MKQHTTERGAGIILLFLLVGVIALAGMAFVRANRARQGGTVTDFASCKQAGYPIQESYPEVCRTPNGRSFSNPAQK